MSVVPQTYEASIDDKLANRSSRPERIETVDAMRGFGLWGILLVNWMPPTPTMIPILDLLFTGSFYVLFTFLFGFGFGLQTQKGAVDTSRGGVTYLLRLIVLWLFGMMHFVLFYMGDILHVYAVFALMLFVLYRKPVVFLCCVAAIALITIVPNGRQSESRTTVTTRHEREAVETVDLQFRRRASEAGESSYFAGAKASLGLAVREVKKMGGVDWWRNWSAVAVVMLLGFWTSTSGLRISQISRRMLMVVGLLCFAGGIAFGSSPSTPIVGEYASVIQATLPSWQLLYGVGNVSMGLFVIILSYVILSAQTVAATRISLGLAAAGRMSLSNYIAQSISLSPLLWGNGFENLSEWWRLLILNAFFGAQVLISVYWLKRYQLGPLEWVWRSLARQQRLGFSRAAS